MAFENITATQRNVSDDQLHSFYPGIATSELDTQR